MTTQTEQMAADKALITRAIDALGTQEALADALDVSQTTVSKWLSGKTRPRIEHAFALERVTDGAVRAYELRAEVREYLQAHCPSAVRVKRARSGRAACAAG